MKRPDEFVSYGRAAARWLQEHQRELLLYTGAFVGLLAAVFAILTYRRSAARQANADLGAALAVYRAGRYDEAAQRLLEVAQRWERYRAGQFALVAAAQARLQAGQADGAAELLRGAASAGHLPEVVRQQANLSLAYSLESLQDSAGSRNAFSLAEQLSGPYRAVARYEQLRLALQANDFAKAQALLESLEREFPQSEETRRAKALLRK